MKKYIILTLLFLLTNSLSAQTINYVYDNLGRLTQATYPDSSLIKYTYDASGNRTTIKVGNVNYHQVQTITFNPLSSVIYGSADKKPGSTATSGLPITYISSDTTVATVVNGSLHIVGAGTCTITASQVGNYNYAAAATVSQTLKVNKAALVITAANKTKVYGADNPILTLSYSGFVNGDTTKVLTTLPIITTTATAISNAGSYPISVTGASAKNYTITYVDGTLLVIIAPPSLQATNLKFTNVASSGGNLNWTNGNGTSRVVFIAPKVSTPPLPLDSITYHFSTLASQGTQIGTTGWFCVYNGTGSNTSVAGLKAGTLYRFMVLEYNGSAGAERYLTTASTGNPLKITTAYAKPAVQAINLVFTNTSTSGTTVNWTNGNGTSRVVFIAPKTSIPPLPLDSSTYVAGATAPQGTTIGSSGWFCVYNGSGSSTTVTGLKTGTQYRFMVLEYNGTTGTQRYLTNLSTNNPLKMTTLTVNNVSINNSVNNLAFTAPLNNMNVKVEAANILSPNGDGKNDTWVVKNIDNYPNNTVTVVNQAGAVVYTKKNYANDWGGTYQGNLLDEGTYYFTIDLGNGENIKGFITVLRD